jgi:hypothetical protein
MKEYLLEIVRNVDLDDEVHSMQSVVHSYNRVIIQQIEENWHLQLVKSSVVRFYRKTDLMLTYTNDNNVPANLQKLHILESILKNHIKKMIYSVS